jgi:hypothetical protein
MRKWIIILKCFGYIWITLAVLLIFTGIIGVFLNKGFSAVLDLLSPFNITNWLVTFMTLAPGFGALMCAEKLKKKLVVSNKIDT